VGVAGAKQAGDDFVRAWKRAEKGLPAEEPVNRLHFADTATLFKCLSPKRFELLQHLRESGPLSVRKLAAELHRDYKNVHTDVKDLLYVGLIEETDKGLLSVPWDVIVSELPLLAKAK
jgi:predicted transcriptional regulator